MSKSEDTILHPLHQEGGELERFDRVIANPASRTTCSPAGSVFRKPSWKELRRHEKKTGQYR